MAVTQGHSHGCLCIQAAHTSGTTSVFATEKALKRLESHYLSFFQLTAEDENNYFSQINPLITT